MSAARARGAVREGPLPAWLGGPLSVAYRLELARRNRAYDKGRGVRRLDRPVISVGNLSVGGVGKTPMVARILGWLRNHGAFPCVAMRGYKAKNGFSDEAELHRRAFTDRPAPVVAQADRLAGLEKLFDSLEGQRVDCVVLDDGFQHRRIARDLDVVLLDASRSLEGARLLPAGYWREPPSALMRAHAVVITHAELVDPDALERMESLVERYHGKRPIAVARHSWRGLRRPTSERHERLSTAWLTGKSVVGLCAIGRPEGFFSVLDTLAGDIVKAIALPDHHPLDPRTLRAVAVQAERLGAEAIVVSEKDWMKIELHQDALGHVPLVVSELTLKFDRGASPLERKVLAAAGLT